MPATSRPAARSDADHRPRQGRAPRHRSRRPIDDTLYDAFGQRQVSQYFTQLNQYHVVLEVEPSSRPTPASLEHDLCEVASTGQQVPLSAFVKVDTAGDASLSINHQGQFPGGDAVLQPGAGRFAGRRRSTAIQQAETRDRPAGRRWRHASRAAPQAFQASLASEPFLIAGGDHRHLHRPGHALRELHPSASRSCRRLPSAGVGALLALMVFGYDLQR